MANVENLEKKFLQQLQQTKSFAIALTGEWGIGKTHFWKSFYNKKRKKFAHKKYAYVSLFGIESLESLGYEIAIKSQGTSTTEKENEKNSKVKSFFTNMIQHIDIPKIESNGFALSIGQNLVSSIISNMVSETIICIDDLERKSNKLDMKDLMGFISQLKTEKNCQVIVILHQDKINEQNTEFQEYKEKVFDEVFYLTDNFSTIKEMIKNTEMIDIYQEFYDKLKVKNLRFYQKVDKDFQNMMSLGHDFSYTSKEYILKNLMIIRLADMIPPTIIYKDKENNNKEVKIDLDFLLNFHLRNLDNSELSSVPNMLKSIKKHFDGFVSFYNYSRFFIDFYKLDDWGKVLVKNIINHHINDDLLKNLLLQNKISEHQTQTKIKHTEILKEFHNLNTKDDFINRFYQSSIEMIPFEHLNNLFFYYQVILMHDKEMADKFKTQVENHIIYTINSNKNINIEDFYPFKRNDNDIFYTFLLKQIQKHKEDFDYYSYFTQQNIEKSSLILDMLNLIDKETLKNIIWTNSHEYHDRTQFIISIISKINFSEDKQKQVRQWIVELLQEKVQENPDSKIPIEYWLKQTENLTKFD